MRRAQGNTGNLVLIRAWQPCISICLDSVLDQIVLCGRDVCSDTQAVSKSQKITDVNRLRSSQALIWLPYLCGVHKDMSLHVVVESLHKIVRTYICSYLWTA